MAMGKLKRMVSEKGQKSRTSRSSTTPRSPTSSIPTQPRSLHSSPDESPPAKKPRLKLNVKPPFTNDGMGDTIAVSRSKRRVTLKLPNPQTRQQGKETEIEPSPQSASASFLRIKTGKSRPALQNATIPASDISTTPNNGYGDFLSYYVAGCESVESGEHAPQPEHSFQPNEENDAKAPTPLPPHKRKPRNQPANLSPDLMIISPPSAPAVHLLDPISTPTIAVRQRVTSHGQYAPASIMHKPMIEFTDLEMAPKPTKIDDVATMIAKLERLSTALTDFGGAPPVLDASPPSQCPVAKSLQSFRNRSEIESEADDEDVDLNLRLEYPGTEDGPLTHGVQFIQNALKSWAQQRLSQQVMEHIRKQCEVDVARQHVSRQSMDEAAHEQTIPIRINLAETPEGVAIMAFQSVLNSGCLRVNAALPVELARALRHLYVQIDYLINKGAEHGTQWRCMSYSAQIAAHRARIALWRDTSLHLQGQHLPQPSSVLRNTNLMHSHLGGPGSLPTSSRQHEAHPREKGGDALQKQVLKACVYDLTQATDSNIQQYDAQGDFQSDFFKNTVGNEQQMNTKQQSAISFGLDSLSVSYEHNNNTVPDSEHAKYSLVPGTSLVENYSYAETSLRQSMTSPKERMPNSSRTRLKPTGGRTPVVRSSKAPLQGKKSTAPEREIIVIDDSPTVSPGSGTRPLVSQKGMRLKPTKRPHSSCVGATAAPSASM